MENLFNLCLQIYTIKTMKKKYIILVILISLFLVGCMSEHSKMMEKDITVEDIESIDSNINDNTSGIVLEFGDSTTNAILSISSENTEITLDISSKCDEPKCKENECKEIRLCKDNIILSSEEYDNYLRLTHMEDSIRLLVLKEKELKESRLSTAELKEIQELEYQFQSKHVNAKLKQLEDQHSLIDSLLNEKRK